MSDRRFINVIKGLQSELNKFAESHGNTFITSLNETMIPMITSFSDWTTFKEKIETKEYFVEFNYNSKDLQKYSIETYNRSTILFIIKTLIILATLIIIFIFGHYFALLLFIPSIITLILVSIRKDKRVLFVGLNILSFFLISYFLDIPFGYALSLSTTSIITHIIFNIHYKSLLEYSLANPFRFLELFENKIIRQIKNKKEGISHIYVSTAFKDKFNAGLESYNTENGTNIEI